MSTRILSCPVPGDINPLSPNGYQFSIERLPEITYFCQEVNLPDVSFGTADVATPFSTYPMPGDRLSYGDLNVQFLVDTQMENYRAVFDWMNGLGFPENYTQYTNQVRTDMAYRGETPSTLSDATLIILNNNNIPIKYVRFFDCFPIALSSLTFSSTVQDVNYIVGNATFRFSYYKFDN